MSHTRTRIVSPWLPDGRRGWCPDGLATVGMTVSASSVMAIRQMVGGGRSISTTVTNGDERRLLMAKAKQPIRPSPEDRCGGLSLDKLMETG
jgi:hypothetical protein